MAEQVTAGRLAADTDFARVKEVGTVIICVPTSLNKNREPDISYILQTGRAIAPFLRPGTLVVLESITYPGTTDEDLCAVLEAGSDMKAGQDFHLVFSPEREDPANPASKVGEVPNQAVPWWRRSDRAKELLTETAGYLFEALLNSGRGSPLPFDEERRSDENLRV